MNSETFKFGGFLLSALDNRQQISLRTKPGCRMESTVNLFSFLQKNKKRFLLVTTAGKKISLNEHTVRRLLAAAEDTQAGMIYSDYFSNTENGFIPHPLIDYQPGSIRDNFHFGHVFLLRTAAAAAAFKKYGAPPGDPDLALYDLRLKISLDHPIFHIPEFLYSVTDKKESAKNKSRKNASSFIYAAANTARQKNLEKLATNYLRLSGAYLTARTKKAEISKNIFPVRASIVIPVLNRKRTIADALHSALNQRTSFDFNILVIDNHSTDGTTQIIQKLAGRHSQIKHLLPHRLDLSIGGCWNEAIYSPLCGRFAVQLDSDDLYSSSLTLQKLVHTLERGKYAMVVGSYTIVDEHLRKIPPGLIDHREWTNRNGHNNVLRVNGLGAPRAFDTQILRRIGFPDVGYGEDYAVVLRITREYRIGRIYESLYLCRRWKDNTDASPSVEKLNRNDFYKDRLRSMEIAARKTMNQSS